MTRFLNKYKKPLLFVLALVPIAIVGGYFTGVYSWTELTADKKIITGNGKSLILSLMFSLFCKT